MLLITYAALCCAVALSASIALTLYYSHPKTPYLVQVTVQLCWFAVFAALSFVIPLDFLPGTYDVLIRVWSRRESASRIAKWRAAGSCGRARRQHVLAELLHDVGAAADAAVVQRGRRLYAWRAAQVCAAR
jgi:hypothetical protein